MKYIEKISFIVDVKILVNTIAVVFMRDGITDGENATALDYGDTLLKAGKISREEYDKGQEEAKQILEDYEKECGRHE